MAHFLLTERHGAAWLACQRPTLVLLVPALGPYACLKLPGLLACQQVMVFCCSPVMLSIKPGATLALGPCPMSMAARFKVSAIACSKPEMGGKEGGLQTICRSAMPHLPYLARCVPGKGAASWLWSSVRHCPGVAALVRAGRTRVCAMASRAQPCNQACLMRPDPSSRCIPYPTQSVCKHPGPLRAMSRVWRGGCAVVQKCAEM